jgi:hypothetical protein
MALFWPRDWSASFSWHGLFKWEPDKSGGPVLGLVVPKELFGTQSWHCLLETLRRDVGALNLGTKNSGEPWGEGIAAAV